MALGLDKDDTVERGYPATATADRVHDASDLHRAIEAYKFLYATVATAAVYQELPAGAAKLNERSSMRFVDVLPRRMAVQACPRGRA